MGTRAFSHDSIFIPEAPEHLSSEQAMAQDSVSDKVRSLQRQIAHNIKFGQKPTSTSFRRSDAAEGSSDDEDVPRSPLKVVAQIEAEPVDTEMKDSADLPKNGHTTEASTRTSEVKQDTPVKSPRQRRAVLASGTIESINLDAVPRSASRLDNTAAKHKLAIKPKNQRASKKHRRLTQDLHNLSSCDILQEEADAQKQVDSPVEGHSVSTPTGQKTQDEQETIRGPQRERTARQDQLQGEEHQKPEGPVFPEAGRQRQPETEVKVEATAARPRWDENGEEGQRDHEAEEQRQHEMEEQRQREMEEQRQREMEKQRQREMEEQRQREMEEQRQREMEEQRQREMEKQRQREMEEQRQREMEEQRQREMEEQRQRVMEEQRQREMEEQRQMEREEQRQRKVEEQRQREMEEQSQREMEEQRQREREEQRKRELEEEQHRTATEKRLREEEEQRKREAERQRAQELEEQQRADLELQKQHGAEEAEGKARRELEERKLKEQEEWKNLEKLQADEKKKTQKEQSPEDRERVGENTKPLDATSKQLEETWKTKPALGEDLDPQERKRRAEEVRWKELEERQTMPRPFTFKVSSGEKQILFQKVNLTPVAASSQQGPPPDAKDSQTSPKGNAGSHSLPSSLYVPHTAILVTGAQLCGTAVNLNQIKDTACKSLLGLGEDKKTMEVPPIQSSKKTSPERKTNANKTKSLNESARDQASAAILAEWASIRSKILKSAENENLHEREARPHSRPASDDFNQKAFPGLHSNLRKTMSATAKFSITPAWQKFTDGSKAFENESAPAVDQEEKLNAKTEPPSPDAASDRSAPLTSPEPEDKASKPAQEVDGTEGCVFAKDLPSFLVPSPPPAPNKPRSLSESQSPPRDPQSAGPGGRPEEKPSPFGIKLRRTNYSLRFHSEQPSEKRKKRYSAGDSFEGVPAPLLPSGPEKDAAVFPSKPRDRAHSRAAEPPQVVPEPRARPSKIAVPAASSEGDRPALHQKPSLAPKPADATPPCSPLAKADLCSPGDKTVPWPAEEGLSVRQRKEEHKDENKRQDEEPKEKRSFFPSINISWREKMDRRVELIRREKPTLQSRHSLDSSRGPGRGDAGQPLWISLALQKQKGFREQQLSREEKRHMREARLAEKQAKDNSAASSPSENAGDSHSPVLPKPPMQDAEKKPDTLLSRFERREQLKKSNTLPNSVTVEISDSPVSAPPVKEVPKRVPPAELAQVSSEPAWLALAKRKAKAWSDCPQIIK
ncbi:capping protein inhibiting regulator of actin dynamics isoform X3 [Lepisosteus oculatus]|uniref:capping protein inhibiting regulator of actin dynamics isoform X3 n=2 Tax=Lepisosteus oculatus TaxID=7918 RepID=UPI0035F51CF0